MKKTAKKWILGLCFLFVITGAVFAEEGLNLSAGAGVSMSLLAKPYVFEDVNMDYEFGNGIALGGGVKVYENVLQRKIEKGYYNDENFLYFMPYSMFQYKCFTAELGANLFPEADGNLFRLFYCRLGGDIPLVSCGSGKFGIDFGLEGWISRYSVYSGDPEETGKSTTNIAGSLGTAFGTFFNVPKASVGIKYYLPL